MKKQTAIAFKTLKDIYGTPSWANSPDRKTIEAEWDRTLEPYTEEQVKKACLRYAKFHNAVTKFPNLTIIEAELVDEEVNKDVSEDKKIVANRAYAYCMQHASECNPVPEKISIQRAIWSIYKVAVDGFNPKEEKEE